MPANEAPAREDDVDSESDDVLLAVPSDPGLSLSTRHDVPAQDRASAAEDRDEDLEEDLDDDLDEDLAVDSADEPLPKPARGFRYAQLPPRPVPTLPESDEGPAVPLDARDPELQPETIEPVDVQPVVTEEPVAEQLVVAAAPVQAPVQAPVRDVVRPGSDQPAPADEPSSSGEAKPDQVDLLASVERLRMYVATMSLTLDMDGADAARKERESLLSQLDDYLLPRLRRRDAPLLAVIGGSTGAGKSTLTNSLVRREVSRSGVLRPTTRSPVLVHHPQDSGAFMSQRILPRLERITSEGAEPLQPIEPHAPRITGLRLVPHDGLTPGMAIIDAPDIDSLVETNRDLAVQLLGAADLWIFVTTAARYADAMPWEMLKQASDRGVAVAVVLDRVPPEALQEVRVHLATRLRDRGLGGAPLFTIPETQVGADGFLPERIVQPLQTWLHRVAGDERSRTVIANRTLKGIVGSIQTRAELLASASANQIQAWVALKEDIQAVFGRARCDLLSGLADGSLLSGGVLARWQEHVADGTLVRRLDGNSTSLGDVVGAALGHDVEAGQPLDAPITQAVAAAIQAAARSAVDETVARWRSRPGGAGLLKSREDQLRNGAIPTQIENSLENWRAILTEASKALVERPAGEQAVNPAAASDVLFVVSIDESTDRSEGGNPTVAAARRILETFAGEESVQAVTSAARADLAARAGDLLDVERLRLEKLLEAGSMDARRSEALLTAAKAVDQANLR